MSDWLHREKYERDGYSCGRLAEKSPLQAFSDATGPLPWETKAAYLRRACGEMSGDLAHKIARGDMFDKRDAYHAMPKVAELWAFQTGRMP